MAAPILLLDFARTRRFDRRLVFVRSSPAWRAATATPLRAATAGQPRLETDGLRLEPAATNLLLHSTAFNQTGWTASFTTVAPALPPTVAPDGSPTAWKLSETAATRYFRLYQRYLVAEGVHTASIYAKAAERSVVRLRLSNTAGMATAAADLTAGALLADSAPGATVAAVGDGWYRVTLPMGLTGTDNTFTVMLGADTGPPVTYAGDPACGLHLWGAQLEAGSAATSPIATGPAAAQRAGEWVSLPLARLPRWSAGSGTLMIEAGLPHAAAGPQTLAALSGTGGDGMSLRLPGDGTVQVSVVTGGTPGTPRAIGTVAPGTPFRAALAWGPDGVAAGLDGGAMIDCDDPMPDGIATLHLGHNGGTEHADARLRRVAFHAGRLPDAVVRRLTRG